MRNPSTFEHSTSRKSRHTSPQGSGFRLIYVVLFLLTAGAIATPPAIAINLMPDTNIGALMMILSVAVLMFVLVIEIWRHTASSTGPVFDQRTNHKRKKPAKPSKPSK